MVKLQQPTIMPFNMQQQLQSPPAIIVHRFCSMPAETLSSQAHTIFIPPLHFSKLILHRGTIIMFMAPAAVPAGPIIPVALGPGMPGMPIPVRSIMIADVIRGSFQLDPSVVNRSRCQTGRPYNDERRSRFQHEEKKSGRESR
jgi:hypothetical protein